MVRDRGIGLTTPKRVQKLQMALHAKAKAEAGYRFYALYDKISREEICWRTLMPSAAPTKAHRAWTAKTLPEDIEAYGVERWLADLALALREETYRPEPIRRVFIPKANGKFRPLGISTVRDRVCMTAAMLVLEPIFEADLPPEIYAYRAGRNAQQAAVEVEELLFRGHREVAGRRPRGLLREHSAFRPSLNCGAIGLERRWRIHFKLLLDVGAARSNRVF